MSSVDTPNGVGLAFVEVGWSNLAYVGRWRGPALLLLLTMPRYLLLTCWMTGYLSNISNVWSEHNWGACLLSFGLFNISFPVNSKHNQMHFLKSISRWRSSYDRIEAHGKENDDAQFKDSENLAECQVEGCERLRRQLPVLKFLSYLGIALCGLCVISIIAIQKQRGESRQSNQSVLKPCGNSSAEALSLGCSWDQLTWSWLPPSCPHYANDEFMKAEQWVYYTDRHGQEAAVGENWARALDNEIPLWGERREHLTHCVYVFLSLGQIIRDGTPYHSRLVQYGHLSHCSHILLEALRLDPTWHDLETSTGRVSFDEHC